MSEPDSEKIAVLFVCHANICRSPMAEGVFRHLALERGLGGRFEIESAGTFAFPGQPPHPFSVEVAAGHGVEVAGESRSLAPEDLTRFEHIIAMDRHNLAEIVRLRRISAFGEVEGQGARIRLLRSIVDPQSGGDFADVPDPVAGGREGFEVMYEIVTVGCAALLDELAGDAG